MVVRAFAPADADLRARFQLAAVSNVAFAVADGERLPADHIQAQQAWNVNWSSAPDLVTPIRYDAAGGQVLLATQGGAPLLVARDSTVVVAFDTTGPIRRWPYFNYLLHCAACDAARVPRESFAQWPASPVPGTRARLVYVATGVFLWTALMTLFGIARRQGRARPDAARDFFNAVRDRAGQGRDESRQRWNQAGFARPLAGLLTLLGTMTFMVGVYFIVNWFLSNRVQPFPEADGLWRSSYDSLIVVAALFECGTNVASMKFFAEHRVARPHEALADIQFYVWWALFQRLAQATLLGLAAVWWLPSTQLAIYAPFVALFGFNGLPAIFQLGKNLCAALQRFDYQNILDILEQRLFFYLVPIPCILAGRAWGAAHPAYGEAFGAALGLGFGTLASNLAVLAVGLIALFKLGVPIRALFLAQFDRHVARRQLSFGGKITVGSEPIFLLKSVETVIIVKMMSDFTAWLGVHQLLSGRLLTLYFFTSIFYTGAIASISEAFSAGKRVLTQYYVARYFQFGLFCMIVVFSLMVAVGPAFIHSLGPQWDRAQPYLIVALVQGLLFPTAWISDQLQQGAGRAGVFLATMFAEQGSRLIFFFLLVPRFHFAGIFLATGSALAVKAIFGWVINHRTIVPLRLSGWGTLGAPTLAGVVNWVLWAGVVRAWDPQSNVQVLVLLCVASAVSFFLCFFVCGLCAGYDEAALGELRQAADMCTFVRPMARAMSACAHAGARLGPMKARPLPFTETAYQEAAELDRVARAALA